MLGIRSKFSFGFTILEFKKKFASSNNSGSISCYCKTLWHVLLSYHMPGNVYMKHEINIFCRGHIKLFHAYKFIFYTEYSENYKNMTMIDVTKLDTPAFE